jgi:general secretion pathway protein C
LQSPDPRARAEFWQGVLRAGVEIALVLVLAAQTARVVWIIAEPAGPFGTPVVEGASDSARELAILKTFNPFAPRGVAPTVTAEDTSGFTLHGIRVGNRGAGSAIIGVNGKQSVYWVGEEIATGAILKEVASDHVVVARGDRISHLSLVARAPQPNANASVPSYMLAPRPAATAAQAKPAVITSVDTKKLLDEAGLRPRTQGGQITGYTLLPRGAGEMLGRAGLAAGDVLVALNGNRLTPERYSEIEQELTGASQVQLTVERGNETRTITLQTGK